MRFIVQKASRQLVRFILTAVFIILLSGCNSSGAMNTPVEKPTIQKSSPTSSPLRNTTTPTVEPTSTPTTKPTLRPETYTHPTGSFSLDVQPGTVYQEYSNGVVFNFDDNSMMNVFVVPSNTDQQDQVFSDGFEPLLDQMLETSDMADEFEIEPAVEEDHGRFSAEFTYKKDDVEGEGLLTGIRYQGFEYYIMASSTHYEDIADSVQVSVLSFEPAHTSLVALGAMGGQSEEASRAVWEDWRLEPMPGSMLVVSDKDGNQEIQQTAEARARELAIPEPFRWEIYILPEGTTYQDTKDFYMRIMTEQSFSLAADMAGGSGLRLMTFLSDDPGDDSKNALVFSPNVGNPPTSMLMILYSNEEIEKEPEETVSQE